MTGGFWPIAAPQYPPTHHAKSIALRLLHAIADRRELFQIDFPRPAAGRGEFLPQIRRRFAGVLQEADQHAAVGVRLDLADVAEVAALAGEVADAAEEEEGRADRGAGVARSARAAVAQPDGMDL